MTTVIKKIYTEAGRDYNQRRERQDCVDKKDISGHQASKIEGVASSQIGHKASSYTSPGSFRVSDRKASALALRLNG